MSTSTTRMRRDGSGPTMIELGTTVIVDGKRRGTIVGRGFDTKSEADVYDVRFLAGKIVLNIRADRLKVAGPGRRDVIGRDLPHNPARAHNFEREYAQHAA